ncbi:MAG: TolC family protein [Rikenellaceae bacterium]|nr:TolC family protein [Rikenellaceae bacterium]
MKKIGYFILLLLIVLPASGQELTVISFDDALYNATTKNPQISAIKYEEDAAEYQKKAAFGLRLPNISLTGAYAYMGDDIGLDFNKYKQPIGAAAGELGQLLPSEIAVPIGTALNQALNKDWKFVLQERDFGLIGATATMPIFVGGKINAANRAAQIEVEEAKEAGNQSTNTLISELVERYFGLSLARQVVNVRQDVLDGMEQHLNDAIALEENGMVPKAVRLYAEIQVVDARKELQESVRDVMTINNALSNTLHNERNYAPATSMFIVNNLEEVEYFKTLALNNNPQLKQVELKEKLAEEGVKVQRADFMPEVAILGAYDIYNYNMIKGLPNWVVGAEVKIKIFDGLSRENKFYAEKSQVNQVKAIREKAESDILTLVEKTYNDLMSYAEQVKATEASITFAKEYLRMQEIGFREGVATSTEVVDARLNLAKSQTERLQAAYQFDLQLAKLLEACGISFNYPLFYSSKDITPINLE